jgi:hypothetical protein
MADLGDQMKQQIASLSDEDLVRMLTSRSGDYRPEALDFALAQARQRGVQEIGEAAVERLEMAKVRQADKTKGREATSSRASLLRVIGFALWLGAIVFYGLRVNNAVNSFLPRVDVDASVLVRGYTNLILDEFLTLGFIIPFTTGIVLWRIAVRQSDRSPRVER